MPPDGIFDRLVKALNVSNAEAIVAADSIMYSIIPDNDNFTEYDAIQWERRLAIYTGAGTPLADRKAAILQKMAYPGTDAPRGAASYLQAQLQLAGFDVHVYQNRFPDGFGGWITKTPSEILGLPVGNASLGSFDLGQLNLGASYAADNIYIIANYLEAEKDAVVPIVGDEYRFTFFITGPTVDSFATVLASREIELRQLILQLKPAQTVGFMFINYV